MAVYTDSPQYAAALLPEEVAGRLAPLRAVETGTDALLDSILKRPGELLSAPCPDLPWDHLLLSEFSPGSQYDGLIELARRPQGLPDRIACLAGSGLEFHGFKGRSWAAVPGNVHLAVHLAPKVPVERFEIAFTILAALSVVDALDAYPALTERARIKWVNDILLGDGKVAGVLAYTQSQDTTVTSAILGIGINVEATPRVEATPFVPSVTSVRDHLPPHARGAVGARGALGAVDAQRPIYLGLLRALDRNYRELLSEGVSPLLQRYRERSMVLGEKVTVCTDFSDRSLQTIAEGRVEKIGNNLELFLEGRPEPVTGGRLVLGGISHEFQAWVPEAVTGVQDQLISGRNSVD